MSLTFLMLQQHLLEELRLAKDELARKVMQFFLLHDWTIWKKVSSRLGAKHHLDQLLHYIRQPFVVLVPGWGDGEIFEVVLTYKPKPTTTCLPTLLVNFQPPCYS